MATGLINANPIVYERKERRVRGSATYTDEYAEEPLDELEIFDHVRDIKDPEHPYSLEELKVVSEDSIEVNAKQSHVRVTFTPTVEHCSMATVIGLCLRVKLMRSLPSRYKVDAHDLLANPGVGYYLNRRYLCEDIGNHLEVIKGLHESIA